MVLQLGSLFLRPGEPGRLVSRGGDIDNRIKTLLDGLRMPTDAIELPKESHPPNTRLRSSSSKMTP